MQWLLFQRRPNLLGDARRLLHLAPEWCLRRRLSRLSHLTYVTADLIQDDVDLRLDITRLELADASFDAVICSHVLEHVEDDAGAMRELWRITAPGGWCLVMVPLDLGREQTLEDSTITSPEQRLQMFWQHDHVRLYAADIGDRLASAGFAVERIRARDEFGPELIERCRIGDAEDLWLCRR
jgi:SAM-dependent methyltransferase